VSKRMTDGGDGAEMSVARARGCWLPAAATLRVACGRRGDEAARTCAFGLLPLLAAGGVVGPRRRSLCGRAVQGRKDQRHSAQRTARVRWWAGERAQRTKRKPPPPPAAAGACSDDDRDTTNTNTTRVRAVARLSYLAFASRYVRTVVIMYTRAAASVIYPAGRPTEATTGCARKKERRKPTQCRRSLTVSLSLTEDVAHPPQAACGASAATDDALTRPPAQQQQLVAAACS
jgi:hypothetical protein